MVQISNEVFCDAHIIAMPLQEKLLPNPYRDWPFLIIENFLSAVALEEIVTYVNRCDDLQEAQIKATLLQSVVVPMVDNAIRKTYVYTLPSMIQELYNQSFSFHQKEIEAFFSLALTTATKVQLLEYKTGFFYVKHADDSSEIINSQGETIGFKQVAPMRKLTTVLFATSHSMIEGNDKTFTGGKLAFNYLYNRNKEMVTLAPKAGDMIIFPSHPVYSHEVQPVLSGNRITLVQWHNALV